MAQVRTNAGIYRVPSVESPAVPTRVVAAGPHLPTVWGKFARRLPDAHERIERGRRPTAIAVSVARDRRPHPDAPILVLLHGLEGTVRSKYAQGSCIRLGRADGRPPLLDLPHLRRPHAVSVPRLYHSGETTDADHFHPASRRRAPGRAIHRVTGVSLGANVLLKWLGEQGEPRCRTAVRSDARRPSPPPSTSAEKAAGSSSRASRGSMCGISCAHSATQGDSRALERHPLLPVDLGTPGIATRTFWEFDDVFTGPVHGFDGAERLLRAVELHPLPPARSRADPALALSGR